MLPAPKHCSAIWDFPPARRVRPVCPCRPLRMLPHARWWRSSGWCGRARPRHQTRWLAERAQIIMGDSIKKLDLRGVTVATVLPFKDDLTIDWDGYARLLDY